MCDMTYLCRSLDNKGKHFIFEIKKALIGFKGGENTVEVKSLLELGCTFFYFNDTKMLSRERGNEL